MRGADRVDVVGPRTRGLDPDVGAGERVGAGAHDVGAEVGQVARAQSETVGRVDDANAVSGITNDLPESAATTRGARARVTATVTSEHTSAAAANSAAATNARV